MKTGKKTENKGKKTKRRKRAAGKKHEAVPADRLIIADSEKDADLFWATRFLVPDPMTYVEVDGEKILLLKDLEYGRALSEARVDRVVAIGRIDEELRSKKMKPDAAGILDRFLREAYRSRPEGPPRRFAVPSSFPLGSADRLRELGYELVVKQGAFFSDRSVKSDEEFAAISSCQAAAEECVSFIVERLRESEIRGDLLYRNGDPLTSERLRAEAQIFLLERGFSAEEIVIAGGDQGCDPHHRGKGPLPAHRTIVVDVFPRSLETRYWGDMTRTVVRGKASEDAKRLYQDVLAAQEAALALIREGTDGRDIHRAVVDFFAERGRPTEERDGRKVGYFHGTGHGVGIDIHEAPSLGKVESRLASGQVVTVEPGLYYPGVGAVRIEDLVLVTPDGHRNLNRFPKELEIG